MGPSGDSGEGQSITEMLFSRDRDADTLDEEPPWRVGVSMAATWSWGAAVAVAIAVMHTRGLIPYLAWLMASISAIPLFGLAYYYIPSIREWKNLLPMLGLWAFIGFFAIVMNLSALQAALGGGTDVEVNGLFTETQAMYIALGLGILIAVYIHKRGLKGSVLTDVGQMLVQFAGAIGIIVAGIATGARADVPMMVGDQSSWMITAVLGLLAGTTASGMQWQRIEALESDRDKLRAAMWGGVIYAVFQLIVTIAGYFFWDGSFLVSIPFLIAVLAVSTSTSDSGSALLQYVGKRFWLPASVGSLVTLAAVALFPFISEWGVTGIWTFYASARWKIIAGLLALTIIYRVTPPIRDNDLLHAAARRFYIVLPSNITDNTDKPAASSDD